LIQFVNTARACVVRVLTFASLRSLRSLHFRYDRFTFRFTPTKVGVPLT
jgi:hypothetical protein